jgi:hypothetical protein
MHKIARFRLGRVIMHVLALLVAINHFHAPRIAFAASGIVREFKGL